MRLRLFALLAVTAAFGAGVAGAAEPVHGKWNTIDEKTGKVVSTVDLYDQGGKLFAKIVSLTEPTDDQGKPKTCTKCAAPDKDAPIIGLVIIKGLGLDGDRYKGGTIMDPEDGKVYKAEVWPEDGKLKVRGYLGIFYRTQTWTKAK